MKIKPGSRKAGIKVPLKGLSHNNKALQWLYHGLAKEEW
jgi:hypothetical protein